MSSVTHGPLARYEKIAGAHAPGMPGTFSPPSGTSDPDMHHGTCVTHVPWCMPGSLTSVFLWSQWRGKTFPAFPVHAQPQFYVFGKRPMGQAVWRQFMSPLWWFVLSDNAKKTSRWLTRPWFDLITWTCTCWPVWYCSQENYGTSYW